MRGFPSPSIKRDCATEIVAKLRLVGIRHYISGRHHDRHHHHHPTSQHQSASEKLKKQPHSAGSASIVTDGQTEASTRLGPQAVEVTDGMGPQSEAKEPAESTEPPKPSSTLDLGEQSGQSGRRIDHAFRTRSAAGRQTREPR